MSKKETNKKEPLKTFLQDRFDDYKHPVRDDLWESIEQDLFVEKKPSIQKKVIFTCAAVAASLILAFLLIPSFEKNASPLVIVDKTEETPYTQTPDDVVEEKIEETQIETPSSPKLVAVVRKERTEKNENNNRGKEQTETIVRQSDDIVDGNPEIPTITTDSTKKDTSNVQQQLHHYENLVEDCPPGMMLLPQEKSKMSLSLLAMGTLSNKDDFSTITRVSGMESSAGKENGSVKYDYPISVGLMIRKNITDRFSLETGLTYTYLSSKETFEYPLKPNMTNRIKLHYLGIPLKANYAVYKNRDFSVYTSVGGMVEKSISGKIETQKSNQTEKKNLNVSELQWSLLASVGINYTLTKNMSLFIEPGVGYFFDDKSNVETIRKDKPFNFNLQGGLRFSY